MATYKHFSATTRCPIEIDHPPVSDESLEHYLMERYIDNSLHRQTSSLNFKSIIRGAYYRLRPLFPVSFRKHLQRLALRGWERIPFPAWPVDTTVDDLVLEGFKYLLTETNHDKVPFIWFWPEGRRYAGIMTHDVETQVGRDFTVRMMEMEAAEGITSSFEVVPEVRYGVPPSYIKAIKDGGCEVCLHGLNHDGRLFDDPEEFARRAEKIGQYAKAYGASGFRSPIMYRNLDWLPRLPVSYDMSVPNTGHLDPQRGGCCTVMPYFIGDLLELPLTTIQDYPLFNILDDYSLDLWRRQADTVRSRFGLLSFIIHPDYTIPEKAKGLYAELLSWIAGLRDRDGLWLVLPREIDYWWRLRAQMKVEAGEGGWRITGEGSDRAVLAYATLEGNQLRFELANGQVMDANGGER